MTDTTDTTEPARHAGITVPMLFVLGGLERDAAAVVRHVPARAPRRSPTASACPRRRSSSRCRRACSVSRLGQLFGGPGQRLARAAAAAARRRRRLRRLQPCVRASRRRRRRSSCSGSRRVCSVASRVVIARAIVRDREEGAAAARVFSLLMLVSGIAPIAAPLFGGLLIYGDVVARHLRRAVAARRCGSARRHRRSCPRPSRRRIATAGGIGQTRHGHQARRHATVRSWATR